MEHGASRLLYLIAFVRIRVLLFLGAVFPDIALVRLSGYGSHIAFIAQMAALFASSLHPHLALRFRHAVCCCFRVHLTVVLVSYDGVIDGFRSRLARFRHADGTLDFQRFRASLRPAGCAIAGSRVNLSLAAQHGGLALGDWGGLLVRWWFENSRAYLYYFFIVNDCQFVAGHVRMVPRDRSNGGEVFVRCAFPYKAIVNFLRCESHVGFPHKFFCGGFDSGSG